MAFSDGKDERRVLTALITNDAVLARLRPQLGDKPFSSDHSNTVARWCAKYHDRYSRAPGQDVTLLFADWAANKLEDDVNAVSKLLSSLSLDFEHSQDEDNVDFLVDVAEKHFNKVRAENMMDEVKGKFLQGDVAGGISLISEFRKVELTAQAGIDLFQDEALITSALDEKLQTPVVKFNGALKHFYHDALSRGDFVSFMGRPKVGKTWFLCDFAWTAWLQKRKVLFIAIGDEQDWQIAKRFAIRAARHPTISTNDDHSWPCVVKYPTGIRAPQIKHDIAEVDEGDKTFDGPLKGPYAWERIQELSQTKLRSLKSYFKLVVRPNLDITVPDMQSLLDEYARDGWNADVLVCDYADNIAPVNGKDAKRDQVNETWKMLRALAMRNHCLVVTATQIKATGFKEELLDISHFSEDNRKFAIVTGMVTLNQTSAEKERGVYRLSWAALRGGKFDDQRVCYVAGSLALGRPAMVSTF